MKFFGKSFKYSHILHLINLCHVILGTLFVFAGAAMLNETPDYETHKLSIRVINMVAIVLGCSAFFVSYIGVFAVIRKSNCWIMFYTNVLVLLLMLQIAFFTWTYIERWNILMKFGEENHQNWMFDYEKNIKQIDNIQLKHICCGLYNNDDYERNGVATPNSCCGSLTLKCQRAIYEKRTGCTAKLFKILNWNLDVLHYCGIGIMVIECVALLLAWILHCRNRKALPTVKYIN